MSFFQNLFNEDFYAVLVLGDRSHSTDYKCPKNAGRGDDLVTAWNAAPYNLSGNDADGNSCANLTIKYSLDDGFRNWTTLTIDIATGAVSTSSVKVSEIVTALTANVTFANLFTATAQTDKNNIPRLVIRSKMNSLRIKFYIANGTAEEKIGFNKRAGVSELPSFFARHTMANVNTYLDGQGKLLALNPATATEAALINNAVDAKGISLGFSSASVKADWQLLRGRSGLFTFKKQTVDGSSRITEIIEYPAGALAGDFAKKITMTYTAAKTQPDTYAEIPYVLQTGDLITP